MRWPDRKHHKNPKYARSRSAAGRIAFHSFIAALVLALAQAVAISEQATRTRDGPRPVPTVQRGTGSMIGARSIKVFLGTVLKRIDDKALSDGEFKKAFAPALVYLGGILKFTIGSWTGRGLSGCRKR